MHAWHDIPWGEDVSTEKLEGPARAEAVIRAAIDLYVERAHELRAESGPH